jgi:MarR family transcriptional regulator, transcriptional regulator for hemolysin
LNTLEQRFARALQNSARAWKSAVDRRLKHLGLSQASWTTVAIVAAADSPMSQIELANRVGIEAASMVATIDRLVRAGLLQREPSQSDRRVKLITVTEAGKNLYAKVRSEANVFSQQMLGNMDKQQILAITEWLEDLQRSAES